MEKLVAKNPNLKALISCGGWGPYHKDFSAIAATEANRTKFSKSVVKFIREHGFNGIDIDWEFPVKADKHNFSLMLKSLHEAFVTAGKADS